MQYLGEAHLKWGARVTMRLLSSPRIRLAQIIPLLVLQIYRQNKESPGTGLSESPIAPGWAALAWTVRPQTFEQLL